MSEIYYVNTVTLCSTINDVTQTSKQILTSSPGQVKPFRNIFSADFEDEEKHSPANFERIFNIFLFI
jgi:hypothetical protein